MTNQIPEYMEKQPFSALITHSLSGERNFTTTIASKKKKKLPKSKINMVDAVKFRKILKIHTYTHAYVYVHQEISAFIHFTLSVLRKTAESPV